MKRIFLSLAAIAFVAAGSMSVTSCGSDDSTTPPVVNDDNTPGTDDNTPGTDDNTPGTDDNTQPTNHFFTWEGVDYAIDQTTTGVIVNQSSEIRVFDVDLDGDGQGDVICSRWIIASHDGNDWLQNATTGVDFGLFVPIDEVNNTAIWPHESDDIYLRDSQVYENGQELGSTGITSFAFGINVWDEDADEINYESVTTYGTGTVEINYDGYMDGVKGFILNSGKGVDAKPVASGKLTSMKVDMSNIETVSIR